MFRLWYVNPLSTKCRIRVAYKQINHYEPKQRSSDFPMSKHALSQWQMHRTETSPFDCDILDAGNQMTFKRCSEWLYTYLLLPFFSLSNTHIVIEFTQ